MRANVDVRKVEELETFLGAMEERLEDFSVPLSKGADLMLADVRGSFASGGRNIGQSWVPLAPSTIERMGRAGGKRSAGFGEGPTGNLLGSFRKFVRPFVAGVENTAPHAHLFENGRHLLSSIGSGGTAIKVKGGARGQEGREFMQATEATVDATLGFVLDYAIREGT